MDAVETWRDILGPQAIDLSLLAAFVALALVSFFRKSVRLKYVTLAAAVGYMGFVKSRLVSVVDLFAVADLSLPVFKYNLAWYLLSFFVLASTVLWGRLYCGRICAFGALTQLMDTVVPSRLRAEVPSSPRATSLCTDTSSRSGCSGSSAPRPCGSASRCCCWRRCS